MFYIYRFVDKDNKIIYIGKTKQSLRYRFSQHVHLPESCYSKVSRIEYLECQTEADMSMKEIFYINIYRANGLAEYNVSDVSQLPQEISFDEKNDVWKPYMGSLPSVFSHSVNHREKYTEEPKKYIQRYDGRTVKFQQNSITGKEKLPGWGVFIWRKGSRRGGASRRSRAPSRRIRARTRGSDISRRGGSSSSRRQGTRSARGSPRSAR